MSPPAAPRYDPRWGRGNSLALLALCLIAVAGLLRQYADRPTRIGGRIRVLPRRVEAGCEKIDPNLAAFGSLVRLPTIGRARAKAIIEYRRTHGAGAFGSAADLAAVRGIGPATVQEVAPHLSLPARAGGGQ
jgi:competence protein ComEA